MYIGNEPRANIATERMLKMSTIRDAINKCDSSTEMEQVIKEQLETLMQLADKNADLAAANIEARLKDGKINDSLEVPITKVLEKSREARAVTTESNSDIIKKISDSIGKFFTPGKQEILDGIAGILGTAFDALMGAGEGMELKQDLYVVAVEYPAVVRLDFSVWVRNTRASGIRNKCKSAISAVAYKSAVDIRKLDFSTFVTIYSSLLSKCFGGDLKNVDELLDAAENIYKRLGLDTGVRAVHNAALPAFFASSVSKARATVGDF